MAKKFKVPFIFEIRDLWPETFIDMGVWKRTSPQARLFKWIEKRSVSKARKIIALSPRTQAYLEEHYNYSPDDTVYIPNGVYLDGGAAEDLPDEDETIARLETLKREGASVVLFSGSLIATNKLETIIEAAALLKEEEKIKIVLIGKGQEEEKYRGLIRDRGLENILILPPVRKDRVPALLHRADLLILNQGNVQWGSSSKLYDYMASGRPIISSVHAQHNDIVAQVEGGLSVAPEDPNALETAVRRLAGMPEEEKEAMGKRNREYVEKHHDWKLLAGRLMEMAEGVVK
ncbi:MAG: glycosyltransferase family 4 protein [bacterium]|nr:glycosyltransferase family 4 protein [bacterium]